MQPGIEPQHHQFFFCFFKKKLDLLPKAHGLQIILGPIITNKRGLQQDPGTCGASPDLHMGPTDSMYITHGQHGTRWDQQVC